MKIIENQTIYRENGFTLKELIEEETIYKNCTFIMDKDVEYCLKYDSEKDTKSIITYIIDSEFKCADGNKTYGHYYNYINNPKVESKTTTDYLKQFPLNSIIGKI